MERKDDLDIWVGFAMELQSIAQNGLAYTKDRFDKERFERVRQISAEMISIRTGLSFEHVKDVFCNEKGYQTPKVETRSAIFKGDQILLVKEGKKWSLPGGWVDYNESIASNAIKEVKEEAGLDVIPEKIIAIQDRNRHNTPKYAYGILKVFVLCLAVGGSFQPNNETSNADYFYIHELPALDENKTTPAQVQMCLNAASTCDWKVIFD